jgi:hypothetical protein
MSRLPPPPPGIRATDELVARAHSAIGGASLRLPYSASIDGTIFSPRGAVQEEQLVESAHTLPRPMRESSILSVLQELDALIAPFRDPAETPQPLAQASAATAANGDRENAEEGGYGQDSGATAVKAARLSRFVAPSFSALSPDRSNGSTSAEAGAATATPAAAASTAASASAAAPASAALAAFNAGSRLPPRAPTAVSFSAVGSRSNAPSTAGSASASASASASVPVPPQTPSTVAPTYSAGSSGSASSAPSSTSTFGGVGTRGPVSSGLATPSPLTTRQLAAAPPQPFTRLPPPLLVSAPSGDASDGGAGTGTHAVVTRVNAMLEPIAGEAQRLIARLLQGVDLIALVPLPHQQQQQQQQQMGKRRCRLQLQPDGRTLRWELGNRATALSSAGAGAGGAASVALSEQSGGEFAVSQLCHLACDSSGYKFAIMWALTPDQARALTPAAAVALGVPGLQSAAVLNAAPSARLELQGPDTLLVADVLTAMSLLHDITPQI